MSKVFTLEAYVNFPTSLVFTPIADRPKNITVTIVKNKTTTKKQTQTQTTKNQTKTKNPQTKKTPNHNSVIFHV